MGDYSNQKKNDCCSTELFSIHFSGTFCYFLASNRGSNPFTYFSTFYPTFSSTIYPTIWFSFLFSKFTTF